MTSTTLLVEATPLISTVTVATTPTPIPASPLSGRNGLMIRNAAIVDITLTNAAGTGSYTIGPSESLTFNTADESVLFYATVATGTAILEIMEWT